MDPLPSKEIVVVDSDSIHNTTFVITKDGEVCIQLEGSHTTASETDKKNVKFQDEPENEEEDLKETQNSKLEDKAEIQKELEKCSEKSAIKEKENETEETEAQQLARRFTNESKNPADGETLKNLITQKEEKEMQNISSERNEISQRLEQIIDMFDSFAKNLDDLDIKAKPITSIETVKERSNRKRTTNMCLKEEQQTEFEEPQKQRSRYEDRFIEEQRKADAAGLAESSSILASTSCAAEIENIEDYLKQQKLALKDLEEESKDMKCKQARSISTATSNCELKTFACQTHFSDHTSLNTLDLLEVSSLTSRSEQPNSLNNYAQAENACLSRYVSQQDIMKQPLVQQAPTSPVVIVQQPPTTPQFNVITIEANPIPSSTDLRRPPFWQRLWEVIGDFCAATFLCLQVNRDCIFCLGFIAAFVVSASFLTAFFYHTIVLTPTLWQTEDSPQF